MDHKKFNLLLHGGLYSPFIMSLLFGSSFFTSWSSHALFSLATFTFGSQIGHYMFRGSIAEYWGIINIPVADRRFFFDYGIKVNLTSIMKVDRIENLPQFAHKI